MASLNLIQKAAGEILTAIKTPKAKALGMCEQNQPTGRKRWRDNPDLLTFLAQL